MFGYDGTNVKPIASRKPIPDGDYLLCITDTKEGQSKNGDNQVTVTFKVHEGDCAGHEIPFHRVTFLPPENKGAGMALHFLKCIGQPHEGNFSVNHTKWRGKVLKAQVVSEEYNGYINNKVKNVDAAINENGQVIEGKIEAKDEEEVPF